VGEGLKQVKEMEYFIAKQVAERFNVTPRTVTNWCKAGLLPGARKPGRDWLIPVEALDGFTPPDRGRPPRK